jgi:leader peptidase (prepilin peptidase) / N-methyltransferase
MEGHSVNSLAFLHLATAALFGLLIGSFLNVCIYRIPRDLSVVSPRSFCPECENQIVWYHNIPVMSYAVLRGRCSTCRKPIALRYPLVELTTAVLFALVAVRYGWSLAAFKWALFEGLAIVLFWTDMEERILPDEFTLGGAVAGLVLALFVPVHGPILDLLLSGTVIVWRSLLSAVVGAVLLAAPMWAIGVFYQLIRKREGLGFGDVKLIMLMGSFLGFESGLLALLIGAVSGSVLGIAYILITRQSTSSYQLPFGSFLCVGAAIVPLMNSL